MLRSLFACLVAGLFATAAAASSRQVFAQGFGDGILSIQGAVVQGAAPDAVRLQGRGAAQQLPAGTATLRGRVVSAENGQPLRRATVRATAVGKSGNRAALTDQNGSFEISQLPAGRYALNASKDGFVSMGFGQASLTQSAKNIDLADGQMLNGVDFRLMRSGAIAGRVIDEFGDPIVNAQVTALRSQYQQGQRRLMASGRPGTTNDIGEYRLYGLNPGSYFVSVALPRGFAVVDATDTSTDQTGYAPVYFPGTPDAAGAQTIAVGSGATVSGINVQLIPVHTARVSGVAYDSQGQPLRGGAVMITQNRSGMMNTASGGQIKSDGTFLLSNVPPGDYVLQAQVGRPGIPQGPGSRPEFARAAITITGSDITDVVLAPVRPAYATGRLVFDGSGDIKGSSVRINAAPVQQGPVLGPGGPPAPASDDLTFAVQVQPGLMTLRPLLSGDWVLRAVRVNGFDVTDSGIDFKAGESVDGIEIDITSHPPEISGAVTNDRNEAIPDCAVLLFPQDRDVWTTNSRGFAFLRSDKDGHYKSRALPPGRYYAIALDSVDQNEWRDPEYLGRVSRDATQFSLSDGQQQDLDLKVH